MIRTALLRTSPFLAGALLLGACPLLTVHDPLPTDATAPAVPLLLRVEPAGPSPVRTPRVFGQAEAGARVDVYLDGDCSGAPAASGSAEAFSTAGLEVAVVPNAVSQLVATATDAAGNRSACAEVPIDYVHDDVAPAFAGDLTAAAVSPSQVAVTWQPARDPGTDGAALRYDLCVRPTAAGGCTPFAATHETSAGATLWNVGGLEEGTRYSVAVRVRDAAGNLTVHASSLNVELPTAAKVQSVGAGAFHTCSLEADATVRCWGWNFDGQLGGGTDFERSTLPVTVAGLRDVRALAVGGAHACAVSGDRSVRCWGDDGFGQRGGSALSTGAATGASVNSLPPTVSLVAGLAHTCALAYDGSVRCWGDNAHGQLGDGTTKRSPAPTRVSGLEGAVALAAGDHHTCALRADGSARCWGGNVAGELGDRSTIASAVPVPVAGLQRATALVAGWAHTCALSAEGAVQCWGQNSDGQLGDGSGAASAEPVTVSELSGVRGLAAGWNHTCALKTDGTVSCFGRDADGQLGRGSSQSRTAAAPVRGLTGVVSVTAGEAHTCARTDDHVVYCWGRNDFGQLGDGSLTSRPAPVSVTR